MIPNPNNNANKTMKFSVTVVPIIPSAIGKNRKATNTLSGTLNATKNALVTPIKNMSINNTSINPMMIVFTRSLKEVAVALLWSPVITTLRSGGIATTFLHLWSTISFTLPAALIRFSPARFTMFNVTTFFPSRRA